MGAAPPRQTEIRLKLPGTDFSSQLRVAMDAFFAFGFPAIGEDALAVIRRAGTDASGQICLSVITSRYLSSLLSSLRMFYKAKSVMDFFSPFLEVFSL